MAYLHTKLIGTESKADYLLHKYYVPHMYKGFVEVTDKKFCLPIDYKDLGKEFDKFEVRNEDAFIIGFPRSGTTWTQEMVWLLVNNLNFEGAKERQMKRVPLFEVDMFTPKNNLSNLGGSLLADTDMLTYINQLKSPRCIKTHLPWPLLPAEITDGSKHPKIIFVLRNPKDVCISYYNLNRLISGYRGSFQEFCFLFLEGRLNSGPFWETVLSYWEQKHRKNIIFLRYKDMQEDLQSAINEVAGFLGKQITNTEMKQLVDHLNISKMRDNPAINRNDLIEQFAKPANNMVCDQNNFIGKGEQDGYVSIMPPDLIQKFDEWTKKHLEGTDLIVE